MHQDGPSVSTKTCGRAVAYTHDVLTLASHTSTGKDQPAPDPAHHHDQPAVTPPSSRSLADNSRVDRGVGGRAVELAHLLEQ